MYRKFTAQYIFNGYEILAEKKVIITDTTGIVTELVNVEDAGDDIEIFDGMLCPGFINAHCHLELSHMKGIIPEHTGLPKFVALVMQHRNGAINIATGSGQQQTHSELKQAAMNAAIHEMYECGIVAVGDICNTADSIGAKLTGKMHWHNFIEVSGFVDALAHKRLEDVQKLQREFSLKINQYAATLSPHAPYSVSKTLFQKLNDLTANQLITIHNQESAAENELYKNKSGNFLDLFQKFGIDTQPFKATAKSSLQSWLPYFNKKQSLIAVHNSFISKADIAFAKTYVSTVLQSLNFCICFNANQYIENIIPPIKQLIASGFNLTLGTDSYASNHHLSIMEEIKAIQLSLPDIPLEKILNWATINGAKALKMEQQFGSFNFGKKPGVILIENLEGLMCTIATRASRIL